MADTDKDIIEIDKDVNRVGRPCKYETQYRLIKLGLIAEASTVEGKVFIVNPFVVTVGDKINKTVYDLFRKSKWARW